MKITGKLPESIRQAQALYDASATAKNDPRPCKHGMMVAHEYFEAGGKAGVPGSFQWCSGGTHD